ncbi:hypothetical protein [Paenibacillus mucilaginosus]|uniref:hypothetical protein n=1 Tax=Paenibacillus mucilaginosus TaxID=61624 RepID=UPI0002E9CFFC|nr:hypothetical protein [Paenibacillus mucilaginosus]
MKPRRLQIGMWGGFRPEDWARFGSEQISGMEISQFADREALLQFRSFCRKEGLIFGIHTPLLGSKGYTLPRLTSPDPDERHEGCERRRRMWSLLRSRAPTIFSSITRSCPSSEKGIK